MFDKVEFTELDREEAQKLVDQYNKEGAAALPPPEKRYQSDRSWGSRWGGRAVGLRALVVRSNWVSAGEGGFRNRTSF